MRSDYVSQFANIVELTNALKYSSKCVVSVECRPNLSGTRYTFSLSNLNCLSIICKYSAQTKTDLQVGEYFAMQQLTSKLSVSAFTAPCVRRALALPIGLPSAFPKSLQQ